MSRIVYLSWPAHEITGGIKMAFRHVETLREAGYDAIVVTSDGRPPDWFETSAPVFPLGELQIHSDILVFPENNPNILRQLAAWPNRKIVFCQSQQRVYWGLSGARDYRDFGVTCMICVGATTAVFCRRRCPSQPIYIVPNYVDTALFRPAAPKRLQVAFAPRKRPMEAGIIEDLFKAENLEFRSVPWVPISGLKEVEVARILGESALYLSLCQHEAFALSILEALACECVVAGFTGFGARDYTNSSNGFWAAEDDCLEATDRLAQAARLYVEGGERLRDLREVSAATVHLYERSQFVRRFLNAWRSILAA